MRPSTLLLPVLGLADASVIQTRKPIVKPADVNLSSRVPHMLDLIKKTTLPSIELPAAISTLNTSTSSGIALSTLKSLQHEWINTFDWDKEQAAINKYHHFTTEIEGLNIHFIHEVSKDPHAIPVVLVHGWPGSILEMLPVIDVLTADANATSFDVVVPSLPGFGLSSQAPLNWTTADTARILNTLMTQVLGYKKYAVHGTDWGAVISYDLYSQFNSTARALHLNFLPFYPWSPEQLAAANITLSPIEALQEQRSVDFNSGGFGYFLDQTSKPNTIGLALQDSPVGQLAWLADKFILWSDPRRGTGPSVITNNEILRHVSFYFLTQSFTSSIYIYAQNPTGFRTEFTRAETDAPLLYTSFNYNNGFWPMALIEKIGNLVYYKYENFGGHFPSLDNPPAVATSIKHMADFWAA